MSSLAHRCLPLLLAALPGSIAAAPPKAAAETVATPQTTLEVDAQTWDGPLMDWLALLDHPEGPCSKTAKTAPPAAVRAYVVKYAIGCKTRTGDGQRYRQRRTVIDLRSTSLLSMPLVRIERLSVMDLDGERMVLGTDTRFVLDRPLAESRPRFAQWWSHNEIETLPGGELRLNRESGIDLLQARPGHPDQSVYLQNFSE